MVDSAAARVALTERALVRVAAAALPAWAAAAEVAASAGVVAAEAVVVVAEAVVAAGVRQSMKGETKK